MTILGLAESFKAMNRTDLTRPNPTVPLIDGLFLGKYIRYGREILTLTLFKSSICVIKIWNKYLRQFENYTLFGNVAISVIFSSFFIVTFDWNENSEF